MKTKFKTKRNEIVAKELEENISLMNHFTSTTACNWLTESSGDFKVVKVRLNWTGERREKKLHFIEYYVIRAVYAARPKSTLIRCVRCVANDRPRRRRRRKRRWRYNITVCSVLMYCVYTVFFRKSRCRRYRRYRRRRRSSSSNTNEYKRPDHLFASESYWNA